MSREEAVYMAKLAEQAERYEDMVEWMKKIANGENPELSVDERNLLSVAYKNVIGSRRAAWRIVSSVKDKEESKGNKKNAALIADYIKKVEKELSDISKEVIGLLKDKLIPKADGAEAKVFYHKMVGDYYRYLAEFSSGDSRTETANNAMEGYKSASAVAEQELSPTNPIRLGLALNFSVFYYEVMNSPEQACGLAKQAFDDAIAELDTLPEDSYKDSTLIMQLLRDNLTLWTSDMEDEKDKD
eukprot:CAMPEP_0197007644 /NCGR_PEP_ID=MMETSP1380-20130617/41657_1 /TAXON_ID=5936 /ORGANISM="Euplotes crassus, Strain CT5" /LENGTH=242 /DNA_ID=CAMNT_0042427857 /DNA_START=10 /DNA_END=738 /DNA_ORIENTATION=+